MSIDRRVTKSGAVRWDVRLRRPDGRAYKRTFRTKKEAERYEATEIADKARGSWIDPQGERLTVREWFDEWFATNEHSWRRATIAKNRSAMGKQWLPRLGAHEMGAITPRHVQKVVNEMVADGLNPATIRTYYGAFNAMMNAAVDMDIVGRSPCRGIKLPAPRSAEKRVITPDELHALADAIGPKWRAMVYLGGVMGLRFGEVIGLEVGDVDTDQQLLSITKAVAESGGQLDRSNVKTASSVRTLHLPDPMLAELQAHIERYELDDPKALLFADSTGGMVRASNFRDRVFLPAVTAAGLDGLTFHGLRHSAATIWMSVGADARTVQGLLGHTDPKLVLRLYAHLADDAVRRGGDLAAAYYWNA
ncbi:MAG: site-specific integrase [Actinomycetota bacterium]